MDDKLLAKVQGLKNDDRQMDTSHVNVETAYIKSGRKYTPFALTCSDKFE